MESSTDTIRQAAGGILGAVTAFVAATLLFGLSGRLDRRQFLISAALYWGIFLADAVGVAAVWFWNASPAVAGRATLVGYLAVTAAAAAVIVKGHTRGAAAAAAGVLLRWPCSRLFAWTGAMLFR